MTKVISVWEIDSNQSSSEEENEDIEEENDVQEDASSPGLPEQRDGVRGTRVYEEEKSESIISDVDGDDNLNEITI